MKRAVRDFDGDYSNHTESQHLAESEFQAMFQTGDSKSIVSVLILYDYCKCILFIY